MPQFRKKPVVIDAERTSTLIHLATTAWKALPQWFSDSYERGDLVITTEDINIRTLEGRMLAQRDDWVICGTKGELYPCKPDIFETIYDAVETAAEAEVANA